MERMRFFVLASCICGIVWSWDYGHYSTQSVVYPVIYKDDLATHTDNISEFRSYLTGSDGSALRIELTFDAPPMTRRHLWARVQLNRNLMSKYGVIEKKSSNGRVERKFHKNNNTIHDQSNQLACHFTGHLIGVPKSLLTVSLCNGMVRFTLTITFTSP